VSKIGTENESSLHGELKRLYAGKCGKLELNIGGYICDAKTGRGVIIEVQLGSFAPLLPKVSELSKRYKIKIVHPIIEKKYIILNDSERKSPRKGTAYDLFKALLYAPHIVLLPNVSIELALLDVNETRKADGRGSWRRGGVSIVDKELRALNSVVKLNGIADYFRFVPFDEGEIFTIKEFAKKTKLRYALAAKCVYVLRKIGVIESAASASNISNTSDAAKSGKKGREKIWHLVRR
jgi:hypothetical protein